MNIINIMTLVLKYETIKDETIKDETIKDETHGVIISEYINIKCLSEETSGNVNLNLKWKCLDTVNGVTCGNEFIRKRSVVMNDIDIFCRSCTYTRDVYTKIDNYIRDNNKALERLPRLDEFTKGKHRKYGLSCLVPGCGHEWAARVDCIRKAKNGCLKCIGQLPYTDEGIDEQLRLHERPIKRISSCTGKNNKDNTMDWLCLVPNCNHKWNACVDKILNAKSGCPKCAGKAPHTDEGIDEQLRLHERPIKRISSCTGKNADDNTMEWLCLVPNCDHKWNACVGNILRKTGCPKCPSGRSERMCMTLIHDITNHEFVKIRPTWLKYTSGHNLELDGWNEPLKIAVEYNGIQHYEYTTHFHRTDDALHEQRARDEFKKEKCNELGITLICVPYTYDYTNESGMRNFLIGELRRDRPDVVTSSDNMILNTIQLL